MFSKQYGMQWSEGFTKPRNHPQPPPTTQITFPTTPTTHTKSAIIPNHPNYISNHPQPPKLNLQIIPNHPNYISNHLQIPNLYLQPPKLYL